VARDPEIREGIFHDDWRNIDYLLVSPQMLTDTREGDLDIIADALEHATTIATFDTGGWPIEVRRVGVFHRLPATTDPLLLRSWESYKNRFIQDGRVIDPAGNVTTSEGQAYALLRAVYVDDRATFDAVWRWTQANLQVRDDELLAWRWGERPDGTTGLLDMGAAADADVDAALALLFAARQWDEPAYQQAAMPILRAIWEQETAVVAGQRVATAGDWAAPPGQPVIVNPSYFAPYAYRIFAAADPDRPWGTLVDSTYAVLERIADTPELGGQVGLVPNWVALDPTTGAPRPADGFDAYGREFSYDASRLPWRLAVDWLWFTEPRAQAALTALELPRRELAEKGRLMAAYGLDGAPTVDYEALSMYAGALGSLLVDSDRDRVHRVFAEQILRHYVDGPTGAHWGDPQNYYDQNWAWFATALMDGGLSNLWAGERTIDWERVGLVGSRR
jgi:endoglucanase